MQPVDVYGLVGQIIDGQFRVDAPIGEGGFSVVYKGHHLGLDEPVAIKCLKLQSQLGTAIIESFRQRFRDESKIQYRLSQGSLHVVRTIAAGTTLVPATSALVPYMVLEWLDGFTLAAQLRARRERGEKGRPLPEVLKVLDPVAEAMAFAHSLGVVHRDLNPSNVFVAALPGGDFKLKVMDFGVAKVVSDHSMALGPRAATLGVIRMFTPAYGAPEQFNTSLAKVGTYTDVYAFALMVVELLSDRAPVDGDHLGEFMERACDPLVRPTPWTLGIQVGEAVEAEMAKALSVDPHQRHVDIGEMWGALKNAAARDAEAAKRKQSMPPPGPNVTARGTIRMEAVPQRPVPKGATMPFSQHGGVAPPSAWVEPTVKMTDGPTTVGYGSQPPGTLQTPFASQPPAQGSRPPGAITLQGVGEHAIVADSTSVSVRVDPMATPHGPTHGANEGKRGASPLSTTVLPSSSPAPPTTPLPTSAAAPSSPPSAMPPPSKPLEVYTVTAPPSRGQLPQGPRAPMPQQAARTGIPPAVAVVLLVLFALGVGGAAYLITKML